MKTILTEEIDGHEIIAGFGTLTIDPVASAEAITPLIDKSDEQVALNRKIDEIGNRVRQCMESAKASRLASSIVNSDSSSTAEKEQAAIDYQKHDGDYKLHNNMIVEIQKDIPALVDALQSRRKQEFASNAIYFEPGKNESIIDPAEMVELINAYADMAPGKRLLRKGSPIDDNIGKSYWTSTSGKWARTELSKLGDALPSGSIWESDLDDEQRKQIGDQLEVEYIAGLTAAEKTAKKAQSIDSAAGAGAMMRSKLEIQGDSAALKKSQDWYNAEVVKIESKFA